jgi:hypothetical protein
VRPKRFDERLWRQVNERFRRGDHFYVDAPRPRRYRLKGRLMFEAFPDRQSVLVQAAYLAKNLVNLQRFPDANKRTTSIILEAFLESNGYRLRCDNPGYVEFLLQVQRRVPPAMWDGRSFSLRPEYIPWQDDAYHAFLLDWMAANSEPKA